MSETDDEFEVGQRIAERYEVLAVVGRGRMGCVYKCRHDVLGRIVAIKTLQLKRAHDENIRRRFEREARLASRMEHKNLITVSDFGYTDNEVPYLVMDYFEGEPLLNILRREGHLQPERTVNLFIQVCDGLYHAHQRAVIHRDLKPANILVLKNSDGEETLKVVDLGIARIAQGSEEEKDAITQAGEVCGSPCYLSPEQCLFLDLDTRTDVYSLGICLYECLTGRPPLKAATVYDTLKMHVYDMPAPFATAVPGLEIPKRLEEVVFRCLAKEKQERYETMMQVKHELMRSRKSDFDTVSVNVLPPESLYGTGTRKGGRSTVELALSANEPEAKAGQPDGKAQDTNMPQAKILTREASFSPTGSLTTPQQTEVSPPKQSEQGVSAQSTAAPPQQSMAPPQQSMTPPQQAMTPPQQAMTPPQQAMTPPQQSMTPPQQSTAPPQQSTTPPQQAMAPPQQAMAPPQQAMAPPQQATTPPQQATTPPQQATAPPQQATAPPQQATTPPQQATAPPQQAIAPPQQAITPPQQAITPPQQAITPPQQAMAPPQQAMVPPQQSEPAIQSQPASATPPGEAFAAETQTAELQELNKRKGRSEGKDPSRLPSGSPPSANQFRSGKTMVLCFCGCLVVGLSIGIGYAVFSNKGTPAPSEAPHTQPAKAKNPEASHSASKPIAAGTKAIKKLPQSGTKKPGHKTETTASSKHTGSRSSSLSSAPFHGQAGHRVISSHGSGTRIVRHPDGRIDVYDDSDTDLGPVGPTVPVNSHSRSSYTNEGDVSVRRHADGTVDVIDTSPTTRRH